MAVPTRRGCATGVQVMLIASEPDRVSVTRALTVQPVFTGRLLVTAIAPIVVVAAAGRISVPEQPSDGEL